MGGKFMGKDFYIILDIDPETDKKEIRKAYIKLARQYHPDTNKDPDARERFQEINMAYEVLSDDEKRIYYNFYYREIQDIPARQQLLSWWKRYEFFILLGITIFLILTWAGLVFWLVLQF
jgi:curved DNA-binding protein CbpA